MELTRENIEELGSQIAEGKIAIEPYKNKSNTGCDYCEFKNICHFDVKNGGNQYRRRITRSLSGTGRSSRDGYFMDR